MNPLLILLVGMIVVVGGILLLRLHAFLALVLGALVVGMLTPTDWTYRNALRSSAIPIESVDHSSRTVTLRVKSDLPIGTPLVAVNGEAKHGTLATLQVVSSENGKAVAKIGDENPKLDWAGGYVLLPHQQQAALKTANADLGARLAEGFGKTAIGIGILIALASIVGETLMLSGGAERIVASSRRALGEKRAGPAFLVSGFVLGIPVFFDTVFYLLVPLAKVMRVRSGRDYTLYILCVVAGATMTHSLVPPTPGPLFVADLLGVEIGTMILAGLAVSAVTACFGYAYAVWINSRLDIPLRASADLREDAMETVAARSEANLPPLWLSLLPILLPVVLIATAAFLPKASAGEAKLLTTARPVIEQLGDKNIALLIAAVIGLLMVAARRDARPAMGKGVGEALSSAGVIILITSAGGAFGMMLQQTDIAETIKHLVPAGQLAILPLAFVVAALVRTAQGSATVAMITAAGIAGPLAAGGALGFHPVYLALAIGCGSKPIMWMNDSGFWIIGKSSGFTESETFRTASVMMIVMALAGLATVMLGAWLLPMV